MFPPLFPTHEELHACVDKSVAQDGNRFIIDTHSWIVGVVRLSTEDRTTVIVGGHITTEYKKVLEKHIKNALLLAALELQVDALDELTTWVARTAPEVLKGQRQLQYAARNVYQRYAKSLFSVNKGRTRGVRDSSTATRRTTTRQRGREARRVLDNAAMQADSTKFAIARGESRKRAIAAWIETQKKTDLARLLRDELGGTLGGWRAFLSRTL